MNSERTEYDEMADEAIDVLIDESTEGFVLVGVGEDGGLRTVDGTANADHQLLAVYLAIENVRKTTARGGYSIGPNEVLLAAKQVAERYGCLDGEADEDRSTGWE